MPRWVIAVTTASTVVIAIVLGVLWYVIGGWPADHDKYGRVPIPGQKTVQLPEGEVRLSFEGQAQGGGSTRTLEDPPDGLKVTVSSRSGRPVEVESVSSSLYSVLSGDRGHEPYGKIDVAEQGRYRVRARAGGGGGAITVGAKLWNPASSKILGAVGIFFAALVVLLLLELPLLLMGRRKGGESTPEGPLRRG